MLGKRSRTVIVRLSELLSLGSPLDFFIGDPSGNDHLVACADNGKKPNNCHRIVERDHGVGLAIVAALEKPSSSSGSRGGGGGRTGFCSKYFVWGPSGHGRSDWDQGAEEEEEEDYTYVTFHGPWESFTMVYHDRCESEVSEGGDGDSGHGNSSGLGFLSSCQLCGKKLHGQDIYMYRGEKGFCSAECRSAQIVIDERSEQRRSEAPRTAVHGVIWPQRTRTARSSRRVFSRFNNLGTLEVVNFARVIV